MPADRAIRATHATAPPSPVAGASGLDLPALDAFAASLAGPIAPTKRRDLFDALAPLVTDVDGSSAGRTAAELPAFEADGDPFQALIADIAIARSRDERAAGSDRHRRGLLRAVAELAETHAIAADLACEKAAIDLPLDVPDPVVPLPGAAPSASQPMLVVPDMIRTCRDRLAAHLSDADRTRIDVVAALFDHVLADERLSTDVRNTLARLQLPVLRMALADETFFTSPAHPTRRLIERLTGAAAEWQAAASAGADASPNARAGLAALERTVHTAIRGSFEDAAQHARLLAQFERAIVDIAAAQAPPAEPAPNAEDRDVLVIKATIQISQLLSGIDVDREIRFFLLDVWSRVLVEIACRQADAGRDALLARAKRLCFDLAWTTAPKTTSGERARLAGLLPTMIAAIRDGLRVIDYPATDEAKFFGDWTRVLLKAVRGAPGAPFRALDGGIEAVTIDAFANRLREGSFGPETIGPAAGAAARPGLRTADDATPSMSGPSSDSPTAAPAPPPIVIAELRKGEWFDLRHDGAMLRVRLSWVSPLRSFYLFIGADSALSLSLDPAAISERIARGDLRRAASRKDDD